MPFTSYNNRKIWQVDPQNSIIYNEMSKILRAKDVSIFKDEQKINIYSEEKEGFHNLLQIDMSNVLLQEIISGFMPNLKGLKGEINGNIAINNIVEKPAPIANIDLKNIYYKKYSIGHLNMNSTFNNDIIQSKLSLLGNDINLNVDGSYNASPKVDTIYSKIKINSFNPKSLNPYLTDYLYDMSGNIKADLTLVGSIQKPQLLGSVVVDSLSTIINTIHTRYIFNNQKVLLEPIK